MPLPECPFFSAAALRQVLLQVSTLTLRSKTACTGTVQIPGQSATCSCPPWFPAAFPPLVKDQEEKLQTHQVKVSCLHGSENTKKIVQEEFRAKSAIWVSIWSGKKMRNQEKKWNCRGIMERGPGLLHSPRQNIAGVLQSGVVEEDP